MHREKNLEDMRQFPNRPLRGESEFANGIHNLQLAKQEAEAVANFYRQFDTEKRRP